MKRCGYTFYAGKVAKFICSSTYPECMADIVKGYKGEAKFVRAFPAIAFAILLVAIEILILVKL